MLWYCSEPLERTRFYVDCVVVCMVVVSKEAHTQFSIANVHFSHNAIQ